MRRLVWHPVAPSRSCWARQASALLGSAASLWWPLRTGSPCCSSRLFVLSPPEGCWCDNARGRARPARSARARPSVASPSRACWPGWCCCISATSTCETDDGLRIDDHLPAMQHGDDRNDADERVSVFLPVHRLWRSSSAKAGRLLRVLFIRLGAMSTDARDALRRPRHRRGVLRGFVVSDHIFAVRPIRHSSEDMRRPRDIPI